MSPESSPFVERGVESPWIFRLALACAELCLFQVSFRSSEHKPSLDRGQTVVNSLDQAEKL